MDKINIKTLKENSLKDTTYCASEIKECLSDTVETLELVRDTSKDTIQDIINQYERSAMAAEVSFQGQILHNLMHRILLILEDVGLVEEQLKQEG